MSKKKQIKAMTSWRLREPDDTRRSGQGPKPDRFRYQSKDGMLELKWGSIVEAREKCAYPFEYDKTEGKTLIHIDFLTQHAQMFEPVDTNPEP